MYKGTGMDMNMSASFPEVETSNSSGETTVERRERLRRKAQTDPAGADAEVVSASSVGGTIDVDCVEYRNGRGRVRDRIDANAGTVEPR